MKKIKPKTRLSSQLGLRTYLKQLAFQEAYVNYRLPTNSANKHYLSQQAPNSNSTEKKL